MEPLLVKGQHRGIEVVYTDVPVWGSDGKMTGQQGQDVAFLNIGLLDANDKPMNGAIRIPVAPEQLAAVGASVSKKATISIVFG